MLDDPEFRQLADYLHIVREAQADCVGGKCCVAPAPELEDKLKSQLERLRARSGMLAPMLRVRQPERIGFNDGLIYPGSQFPVGTPPAVARSAGADRAPLRGDVRVVVVLVDFTDAPMAQTAQHFNDLFFSSGVIATGSVREYFAEVTHGLVNITGQVVGPFHLSNTMGFYANGASGTGGTLPNARTMAREAAQLANPSVNFAPFDNDGDGFVDAFIVIHAGPGAEVTGNTGHIWSHKWVLPNGAFNADGTSIFAYLTVPEDSEIGVCAHELGHLLFGWPDLYDTDSSSSGIGNWCLMAGGSWNNGGRTPAHPSAWCKVNQGWVSVDNLTTNQEVSIADVKTGHSVHRLWKDGGQSSEFFLVENRQRTLYDAFLPGEGLLIWHIDETIATNSDESHPRVALEQADGQRHLEHGQGRGDAGDAYPGSSGNRTFNSASTPNSKSYGDVDTCVAVTSIGDPGPTMTARLGVRCVVVKGKEKEKEKEKDIKETKEFKEGKDKENKEQKEKDFKDVKEIEKRFDKRPEKPIIDKRAGLDKNPTSEKGFDWPGDWFRFRSQDAEERLALLEQRLAQVEQTMTGAPQPFIGQELRPDLSRGALIAETDIDEIQAQMLEGSVKAKSVMDTKVTDR